MFIVNIEFAITVLTVKLFKAKGNVGTFFKLIALVSKLTIRSKSRLRRITASKRKLELALI